MGHRRVALVPLLGRLGPLAAGLLALAGLTGCDGGTTLDDGFELSGRVEELIGPDQVGDPIPGARVTFQSDTLIVAETTTDDGGRYRLRIETDHRFGQVRAEAGGFAPDESTVFFDQPIRRVDLQLRALPAMME